MINHTKIDKENDDDETKTTKKTKPPANSTAEKANFSNCDDCNNITNNNINNNNNNNNNIVVTTINNILHFIVSYHKLTLVTLILFNVVVFHLDKFLYNIILLASFVFGYFYYTLLNSKIEQQIDEFLKSNRKGYLYSAGLIKIDGYVEFLNDSSDNQSSSYSTSLSNSFFKSRLQFDQKSISNIKPSLTGSYAIDEELHKVIDLVIRDYVDSWFKTSISSRDTFVHSARLLIYKTIRNVKNSLTSVEWEQFMINIVSHSLIMHMRILKKGKEKLKNTTSNVPSAQNSTPTTRLDSSVNSNETSLPYEKLLANAIAQARNSEKNLIEIFFDLEAEMEKSICRDCVSYSSKDVEEEFLQEISELCGYSWLPIDTFNCVPLRILIREIFAHHLIKTSINKITDPDYVNQTILYMSQNQSLSIENFMTVINHSESLDELSELKTKLDEDIALTRSNDKGEQDDQEIKLKLSSLFFVKRRIELRISSIVKSANKAHIDNLILNASNSQNNSSIADDDYKKFSFNLHLNSLEFDTAIKNEAIQLCFIEFMGKQNVQNLMSFYLNAEMFRQFAKKELAKCSDESTTSPKPSLTESKLAIKDFAKGLINSYLLSAVNFKSTNQDQDDEPVNISNRIYYKKELAKTIENLENENCINECLLDDLQAKIYLLMKQKYYPEFKNYPEFHKILVKSDILSKIASPPQKFVTSPTSSYSDQRLSNDLSVSLDDDFDSNSLNECIFESYQSKSIASEDNDISDRSSQSSFELWPSYDSLSGKYQNVSAQDTRLTAIITSAGRCNDLKSAYAIYIIDVTKQSESSNKIDFWQTFRRFNDFNDLHLMIKKKFPNLNIILPGKSFKSSLNDELIEKRIIELNRYLQILTSQDMYLKFPGLLELMLKFLENKRWESQNSFKKKFGSLLTPMISSVQNIQTTLINAPDSVMGIVKGMSDNLLVNDSSKTSPTSSSNNFSKTTSVNIDGTLNRSMSVKNTPNSIRLNQLHFQHTNNNSKITIDENDISSIDRTVLNDGDMQSNNILIRIILLFFDEVFDLKEKNQWLRQPLMAIVKSYMKNIRGDSINRKIKEQIAIYLNEKQIARYVKNFRKRMWPKGHLADSELERSKDVKEITKMLARTTLLCYVSDELRHILGADTTRRGIFDLFDLFQYKTLNKRLLFLLIENLLNNFFNPSASSVPATTPSNPTLTIASNLTTYNNILTNTGSNSILFVLRLHLSKSDRVKHEWRLAKSFLSQQQLATTTSKPSSSVKDDSSTSSGGEQSPTKSTNNNNIPRSKSLFNEIKC